MKFSFQTVGYWRDMTSFFGMTGRWANSVTRILYSVGSIIQTSIFLTIFGVCRKYVVVLL
jgi:hypothetical protein